VHTPFGKGVVREVRNNGRLLVDVQGRALVVSDADVTPMAASSRRKAAPRARPEPPGPSATPGPGVDLDLHGLTVEDALARVESALNDALLADVEVLRIIHGRSGGRIRMAVHRRLGELLGIRSFRLDPHNEGVTIVTF
jgi:dsDNA-specific endonuclease/ATPase MutS2